MSAHIAGMGWVTPLGGELELVWERLNRGETGELQPLQNPENGRVHHYMPVPPKLVEQLGRNPRLRRSSAISYFAVAAGLAALENAGVQLTPDVAAQTAVIFAISDGGVLYTRRFYDQIVKQGANAASPLLFPETVYNAPASHLAALLGIDGASYTLVGDSSVGISALKFAEQLLDTTDVEQCVVVGSEEVDWILCEAYRDWRLARRDPNPQSTRSRRGAILAEGAGALVLRRSGGVALRAVHDGVSFFRQREAAAAAERVLCDLAKIAPAGLVVSCANGTFIDCAEATALEKCFPGIASLEAKRSFGEAPGASALLQVIVGALAVQKQPERTVLVSSIGFNQQASGALLG
jgi:hypothetical protein